MFASYKCIFRIKPEEREPFWKPIICFLNGMASEPPESLTFFALFFVRNTSRKHRRKETVLLCNYQFSHRLSSFRNLSFSSCSLSIIEMYSCALSPF